MSDCRFIAASDAGPATLYLREYESCQCATLTDEQTNVLHQQYGRYLSIQRGWQRAPGN